MKLITKAITGLIVSVGTEIILKKAMPVLIRKGKKILRDFEESQKKGD